ncbi:hypothetical protein L211DRAFT_851688 [Terfezia boudieri ATCC MYA-4762]|uniref:Uncharacterized protein n=1 Tax=Terfezia boudieri ATCC MYA-4762 TaxID=1051890 RepID=A0A3N4LE78_9PEZI|nr:hypothetical protein L211DRAFT_851688 [Terfezia boudieri ATCC MYA-4762]
MELMPVAWFGHVQMWLACSSASHWGLITKNFDNSKRVPAARSSSVFKHISSINITQRLHCMGSKGIKHLMGVALLIAAECNHAEVVQILYSIARCHRDWAWHTSIRSSTSDITELIKLP